MKVEPGLSQEEGSRGKGKATQSEKEEDVSDRKKKASPSSTTSSASKAKRRRDEVVVESRERELEVASKLDLPTDSGEDADDSYDSASEEILPKLRTNI